MALAYEDCTPQQVLGWDQGVSIFLNSDAELEEESVECFMVHLRDAHPPQSEEWYQGAQAGIEAECA